MKELEDNLLYRLTSTQVTKHSKIISDVAPFERKNLNIELNIKCAFLKKENKTLK